MQCGFCLYVDEQDRSKATEKVRLFLLCLCRTQTVWGHWNQAELVLKTPNAASSRAQKGLSIARLVRTPWSDRSVMLVSPFVRLRGVGLEADALVEVD